jgi:hypothetical protein
VTRTTASGVCGSSGVGGRSGRWRLLLLGDRWFAEGVGADPGQFVGFGGLGGVGDLGDEAVECVVVDAVGRDGRCRRPGRGRCGERGGCWRARGSLRGCRRRRGRRGGCRRRGGCGASGRPSWGGGGSVGRLWTWWSLGAGSQYGLRREGKIAGSPGRSGPRGCGRRSCGCGGWAPDSRLCSDRGLPRAGVRATTPRPDSVHRPKAAEATRSGRGSGLIRLPGRLVGVGKHSCTRRHRFLYALHGLGSAGLVHHYGGELRVSTALRRESESRPGRVTGSPDVSVGQFRPGRGGR